MKIRLVVPDVNAFPTDRPRSCPYCKEPILHCHGTLRKPIKGSRPKQVELHRYRCLRCGRTFRHYPSGVNKKDQSQRTVVMLAALMYALKLSYSAASYLLGVLRVELSKMSVWVTL
jgi:transposase-like protein